ncbi:DinB family protein [Polycladomyces subterraneus]|uniref:DinB family protein n=1 Tax=Polycladomyces subterraneus TaxID=1016997 RepID=UPI003429F9C2
MLFDLRPNNKMDHIVGLLHATVSDTYLRLKELVRNMTQEEIDYRGPNGDLYSTAQLLRHLAVVDLNWVYCFKGETISEEHKQIYGPMFDEHGRIPLVRGVSLEQLLHEYDQVQQM